MEEILKFLTQGGGTAAASAINPLAAGLQAVPLVYQGILGAKQGIDAAKIRKTLVRPEMGIPSGVAEATDLMRMMAYDPRMPGQSIAENNLLRSQANAARAIANSGAGSPEKLAALASGGIGSMNAMNDLSLQAAQFQQQDLGNLGNQLNQLGNWQQKAWEWNQMEKFQERAAAAQQLGDASNKNVFGALQGLGGAVASTITAPNTTPRPQFNTQGITPQQANSIPFNTNPDMTRDPSMVVENFIGSQRANPISVQLPQAQYTPMRSLPSPDFSDGFLNEDELAKINGMFNYGRGY